MKFYTTSYLPVNEVTGIYTLFLRFSFVAMAFGLLFAGPLLPAAWALPPEGLDAFAILNHGGNSHKYIYAFVGDTKPVWSPDYQSMQTIFSQPVGKDNYLSYGLNLVVGNKFGDRDAYFLRYDYVTLGQSLSFKLTHIDYRYINSGKNVLSVDYNTGFHIGKEAEFYFSGGLFYRFSLNSWNSPTWSPTNFNTEDREYYAEICFGSKLLASAESYFTIDLNNRDAFTSYNADNLAFDLAFNLVTSQSLIWRIVSSTRFSGLLAGTADLGEQTLLFGFLGSL